MESRGIEPRLSACKAEVLTVITMAPYSILCYLYTLKEYQTFRVIISEDHKSVECAQGGSRTHKTTALNRVPIPVRLLGHKVEWLILGIPHLNTIISISYPARYLQIRITILTTLLPPLAVFPQGKRYPLAGVLRLEHRPRLLESRMLPLHHTPIKHKTCYIAS